MTYGQALEAFSQCDTPLTRTGFYLDHIRKDRYDVISGLIYEGRMRKEEFLESPHYGAYPCLQVMIIRGEMERAKVFCDWLDVSFDEYLIRYINVDCPGSRRAWRNGDSYFGKDDKHIKKEFFAALKRQ